MTGFVLSELLGCCPDDEQTYPKRTRCEEDPRPKTVRLFFSSVKQVVKGCKVRPYHVDSKLTAQGKGC